MKELRLLTEKYMEGTTTNAEEQALRQYFASPQSLVPEDLAWMKALFAYEAQQAETATESLPARQATPPGRPWQAVLRWTGLAASVLLMLAFSATLLVTRPQAMQDLAFIDGKKTTDRQIMECEALHALDEVAYTDEELFDALIP